VIIIGGFKAETELNLLAFKDGKRPGFGFKYTDLPKISKSMEIGISDLKLDCLALIIPGAVEFLSTEKIRACGLESFVLTKEEK